MAILGSANFNGLNLDDALGVHVTTLDNGLGGSGTRNWVSTSGAYIGSDGANRIYDRGSGSRAMVSLGASANIRTRVVVRFAGGGSLALVGRMTNYDGSDFTGVRVVVGNSTALNSLKIQTTDSGGSGTDQASDTFATLSTNTDYQLALQAVGNAVSADLFAADGTTLIKHLTHTLGSPLSGAYWGMQYPGDTNSNGKFDNYIIEDPVSAAAAGRRQSVFIG